MEHIQLLHNFSIRHRDCSMVMSIQCSLYVVQMLEQIITSVVLQWHTIEMPILVLLIQHLLHMLVVIQIIQQHGLQLEYMVNHFKYNLLLIIFQLKFIWLVKLVGHIQDHPNHYMLWVLMWFNMGTNGYSNEHNECRITNRILHITDLLRIHYINWWSQLGRSFIFDII